MLRRKLGFGGSFGMVMALGVAMISPAASEAVQSNAVAGGLVDSFVMDVTEPTESNTGPRLATTAVHNGNVTLTTAQVFERNEVNGRIIIPQNASGRIIIRDNIIDASGGTYTSQKAVIEVHPNTGAEVVIEHNEIRGKVGMIGIGTRRFTAIRNHVHHVEDAFRLSNVNGAGASLSVEIAGNFLEGLIMRSPDPYNTRTDNKTHSDVIQIEGGDGAYIHGNALHAYSTTDGTSNVGWVQNASPWLPVATGTPGASAHPQALSGIMLTPASGLAPITNLRANRNWIYGGEVGINGGSGRNSTTTGELIGNRFDRTQWRATHTIDLDATATGLLTPPAGTADANIYTDTGASVTVRRNQ